MSWGLSPCRERDGCEGGTPTPCGGRCMPYNDQEIGQHVSGALAVGPAFDDAAHPCRLACATGRVSFSEGGPHLSCGSPLGAIHPFGPSEWRPSLGFAADRLTWDGSSGYFMSDNGGPAPLSSARQEILIDLSGLFMFTAGSVAPTRRDQQATPPAASLQGPK